jgi:O-acetylhomoserine/O-acetylserine sulfhydrylase-like pyridoxal-dependent enzyme
MDPEERRARGMPDAMIRLALGIEATEDLVADIERALAGH